MRGSGNGDGEHNRRRTCRGDDAGGGQPDPTPQVIPSCDSMMSGHWASESSIGREKANTYCIHRNSQAALRLF
jgi:hypothetical protein